MDPLMAAAQHGAGIASFFAPLCYLTGAAGIGFAGVSIFRRAMKGGENNYSEGFDSTGPLSHVVLVMSVVMLGMPTIAQKGGGNPHGGNVVQVGEAPKSGARGASRPIAPKATEKIESLATPEQARAAADLSALLAVFGGAGGAMGAAAAFAMSGRRRRMSAKIAALPEIQFSGQGARATLGLENIPSKAASFEKIKEAQCVEARK